MLLGEMWEMNAGLVLKRAREACDLTQERLAQELKRSVKSVSNWETGLNTPRRDQAQQLDDLLGQHGALMAAFGYVTPTNEIDELRRRVDELQAQLSELVDVVGRIQKQLKRPRAL